MGVCQSVREGGGGLSHDAQGHYGQKEKVGKGPIPSQFTKILMSLANPDW